jgi:large subunit ribosomal protein L44e
MKIPKQVNRYCPYCKKKTQHKVSEVSSGHKRGAMKRGGKSRTRKRGLWRGKGSLGRYSKPAITKWKRRTKSTTKKVLLYTCLACNKAHQTKKGKRASKLQIEEKKK